MFRGDFEFHEDAAPSHLGGGQAARAPVAAQAPAAAADAAPRVPAVADPVATPGTADTAGAAATEAAEATRAATLFAWAPEAERELRKIPFFVRGKARRNTERYAQDRGTPVITIETLYDAKAHFSR